MKEAENKKLMCPNCKKELSFNGGTTCGTMDFRICWDCDYKVEDIKYNVEIKQAINNK